MTMPKLKLFLLTTVANSSAPKEKNKGETRQEKKNKYCFQKNKKQHKSCFSPPSLISQATLLCHALSEEPYSRATYAASWSQ